MPNLPAVVAFAAASLALGLGISHGRDNPAPTCHPLLMPAECTQFRESLARAEGAQARHSIETGYRQLLAERERLCPGSDGRLRGEPGSHVSPTVPASTRSRSL